MLCSRSRIEQRDRSRRLPSLDPPPTRGRAREAEAGRSQSQLAGQAPRFTSRHRPSHRAAPPTVQPRGTKRTVALIHTRLLPWSRVGVAGHSADTGTAATTPPRRPSPCSPPPGTLHYARNRRSGFFFFFSFLRVRVLLLIGVLAVPGVSRLCLGSVFAPPLCWPRQGQFARIRQHLMQ